MSDRLTMPSAMSAETAERVSDSTHCHKRSPSRSDLQASVYRMRGELDAWHAAIKDVLAILKADNDEADNEAR